MVGQGNVEVSPLSMALAAETVESGTWRPPSLVKDPASPQPIQPRLLDPDSVSALQTLMRDSVRSGSARSANLSGNKVSGVVAEVPYGPGPSGSSGSSGKTVSLFVGFRGNVAFALAIEGKVNAAKVAAKFLREVPG
jgi:cell division protein FtsI/penicillin-binding protein 2